MAARETSNPVGVICAGLEVQYQPRGQIIYMRTSADGDHGWMRVSLARWSRFLAATKAGAFIPQQEGEEVTVAIGDLAHVGIVKSPSWVVTDGNTWKVFVQAAKSGSFDHFTDD
ncbi:hypothetical protein [Microbispora sp. H10670]|uniref:hypothetical protein n=1 Tax=Microbispora sp. H10670 TaxID=2729108 RepID=UPI0016019FCF|nr:hypothetical protein [Microbispora sp. H10670]